MPNCRRIKPSRTPLDGQGISPPNDLSRVVNHGKGVLAGRALSQLRSRVDHSQVPKDFGLAVKRLRIEINE